jgi:hypothetical protein
MHHSAGRSNDAQISLKPIPFRGSGAQLLRLMNSPRGGVAMRVTLLGPVGVEIDGHAAELGSYKQNSLLALYVEYAKI